MAHRDVGDELEGTRIGEGLRAVEHEHALSRPTHELIADLVFDKSAAERTALAAERTMLAWWRTGLGALGVALAVGRLLPEIATVDTTWPYVTLGATFAVYACALFVMGTIQAARRETGPDTAAAILAGIGTALGMAVIALIAGGLTRQVTLSRPPR